MLTTIAVPQTHLSTLLHLIISSYFAQLSSVLIVYSSAGSQSDLQQEYLHGLEQALRNQSLHGRIIGLQWLDVGSMSQTEFEAQMLEAMTLVREGFITILPKTKDFLHARYYATRYAQLRRKDKYYLFLCEHENPQDFLATEILQFYPHHLMITPEQPAMHAVTLAPAAPASPAGSAEGETTQPSLNKFPAAAETPSAHPDPAKRAHRDINFELWTQKFVGAVGNLDAVLLDAFLPNETFAKNVELYPNKVSDLKGRALRLGSTTYLPYVLTNYVAPGTGNVDPISANQPNRSVYFVGSEAEVVKSFCEVRNCTLRVEDFGFTNWGFIYENGSSDGLLGAIYEQQMEMVIGSLYNWYNDILETSDAIVRSAVTILGPGPHLFPAWRTNILPFTNELWKFLTCTVILCSVVLCAIRMTNPTSSRKLNVIKEFEISLLNIFAVFIQQPSAPTDFSRFSARFFLATILCATITLEFSYSGQLKSILAVPFFTNPVDTIEKWSHTDWKWTAAGLIYVKSIEQAKEGAEKRLHELFEVHEPDVLYNLTFRNDYGFAIERTTDGGIIYDRYITKPCLKGKIVLRDNVYYEWTVAVVVSGWPIMEQFNQHIYKCKESGLYDYWARQMFLKYFDSDVINIFKQITSGHGEKMPPQNLSIENISGAIFVFTFGHVMALIAFIVEMMGHRLRQRLEHSKNIFKNYFKQN